ncbi:hypothetical protein B0T16DRAFT_68833 [Cercophora newfieldiana]|uniref:Uncharacterized protein n=1 Tax=Cercophora newfieldiana TaxID=92897 RepID=A0AA40D2F7_9PEZI|nr:hypothetical protein B0T16DRAFT_68833 [Cercophora newfieldiana]
MEILFGVAQISCLAFWKANRTSGPNEAAIDQYRAPIASKPPTIGDLPFEQSTLDNDFFWQALGVSGSHNSEQNSGILAAVVNPIGNDEPIITESDDEMEDNTEVIHITGSVRYGKCRSPFRAASRGSLFGSRSRDDERISDSLRRRYASLHVVGNSQGRNNRLDSTATAPSSAVTENKLTAVTIAADTAEQPETQIVHVSSVTPPSFIRLDQIPSEDGYPTIDSVLDGLPPPSGDTIMHKAADEHDDLANAFSYCPVLDQYLPADHADDIITHIYCPVLNKYLPVDNDTNSDHSSVRTLESEPESKPARSSWKPPVTHHSQALVIVNDSSDDEFEPEYIPGSYRNGYDSADDDSLFTGILPV